MTITRQTPSRLNFKMHPINRVLQNQSVNAQLAGCLHYTRHIRMMPATSLHNNARPLRYQLTQMSRVMWRRKWFISRLSFFAAKMWTAITCLDRGRPTHLWTRVPGLWAAAVHPRQLQTPGPSCPSRRSTPTRRRRSTSAASASFGWAAAAATSSSPESDSTTRPRHRGPSSATA